MSHPLQCPNCQFFKFLKFVRTRFEQNNKGIEINIPYLICKNCGHKKCQVPIKECENVTNEVLKTFKDGEFYEMPIKHVFPKLDEEKRYSCYSHLEFTYDPTDYYLIPGLFRQQDDGFLTPVFFDKDILLYYNNHPDYSVKLTSFSSGNIYYKGDRLFGWGFGINRNGKVFKWLGDLNDDFKNEEMKPHLKRFQASNVPSDHDVLSKFYLSQNPFTIKDVFQKSDNEYRLFNLKSNFEHLVKTKYKVNISKLDVETIIDYYVHPILNDKNQIFEAYLKLDKLINENIEQGEIKKILLKGGFEKKNLEGMRSIKLFTLFLDKVLKIKDSDSIVTPLFVLNYLRQLHGHLSLSSFNQKYNSCKTRLGENENISDLEFFEIVVKSLGDLFEKINLK